MPLVDLPLEALRGHQITSSEPDDFDQFWDNSLKHLGTTPSILDDRVVDCRLSAVQVHDLTFAGWNGDPVRAWLIRPNRSIDEPLPCVIEYVGYGGGRGLPHEHLLWASAGFAHVIMDSRGQGGGWADGETADPSGHDNHPGPGFMTRGIFDPQQYYFRRLYCDAVRVVDAARSHSAVNPDFVAVIGASQGAALALVAAAYADVQAVVADVPFLADIRRATQIASDGPYLEIARYLANRDHEADRIFDTLDYFDAAHFASRGRSTAHFSVGAMDATSPPSGGFAAYNAYAGPKTMKVWPFGGHDAGAARRDVDRLDFLGALADPPT